MTPAALNETRWTTGFWAQRYEACRTKMVPEMWKLIQGTERTHFLENFRVAAGLVEGRCRGAAWNDGETYKWLEAACSLLAVQPDASLRVHVDEAVDIIAKAQRADGYLYTKVLIGQRAGDAAAKPFSDRFAFEMYCMGHLMTAACRHHQTTGTDKLLTVARKAADFLIQQFANPTPEQAKNSVCPSHYMGFLDLWRETGDVRYRDAAQHFIEMRRLVTDGGDDNQDRIPFEQQTNAIGHAVRANYLYAGAADLFMETGDTNLWSPLEPIWRNLTEQKMYITGGCGALYDGASPYGSKNQSSITRTHQAFGHNYELPNTTAHNETCANIGNVLWNWRMFLATGEARFMDIAELALYNSVLSGMSLDGTNFFYTNPLRVTDPLPTELRWPRERVPFLGSFCCPPNLARTIASSAQFAYAKSSSRDASSRSPNGDGGVAATPTIWVSLYGASELETDVPGIGKVKLAQETEYPWNGRVHIKINEASSKEFALKLRIPGWAKSASLRINYRPADSSMKRGSYHEIRRAWRAGDFIDLDLQMDTELIEANPLVEETLGQVAVKRGPIVYCLESVDLPRGVKPLDVSLSPDTKLRARYDQRLLGGVALIEGTALVRTNSNWSGQLYRELQPSKPTPIKLRLIPYSAWANRGPSQMSVWLPFASP